ncbi:MAG: YqgE/AlgH family protein [Alphaproteobacteria bacterium]|jgi:putative transcriptional regulator|nr:YqgE/AlgH family protein [Alphaproteobacteria bacterium]
MDDLTGKILVAMPNIGDTRFARSVILMCTHSDEYAMGLVLNDPIKDLFLADLFEQLDIEQNIKLPETYVLNGGPVSRDRGFVIHSDDYFCDGATMEVTERLCMTATHDVLVSIASGGAPAQSIMTLGYSGWGAGQLEHELSENAWIVTEPDDDLVFGDQYDQKWERSLQLMGISSAHLLSGGGTA